MSSTDFLEASKARMEARFTDACVISSDPEGPRDDVTDEDTGTVTEAADDPSVVYRGPCLVSGGSAPRPVTVGGTSYYEYVLPVSIPVTAAVPPNGSVVLITKSGDIRLKGQYLYVTGSSFGAQQSRRRLTCTLTLPSPL